MQSTQDDANRARDAWICLVLDLFAAFGFFAAWWIARNTLLLLAGVGCAVLARIWYVAPINFAAFVKSFSGPVFSAARQTYPHKFSAFEGLLSIVGWGLLLTATLMWVINSLSA